MRKERRQRKDKRLGSTSDHLFPTQKADVKKEKAAQHRSTFDCKDSDDYVPWVFVSCQPFDRSFL